MVQVRQQAVSVVCNLQEPLGQVLLHHRVLTSPAAAFFYLFIGQYGVAGVAPVHLGFLLVCQTSLVENFKEFLGMFVIVFPAGQNFSVPVIGQAQFLLLAGHIVNVGIGPVCRRNTVFNSRIFCRHAKGIKAHGMDYIESLHFLETGHHIADGIVSYMAHMEIAGGIREHFQHIIFLLRGI